MASMNRPGYGFSFTGNFGKREGLPAGMKQSGPQL